MAERTKTKLIGARGGGKKAQYKVEGSLGRRDCGPDAPPDMSTDDEDYEGVDAMDSVKLWMRNHSAGYLVRWSWWVGLGLFLMELLGTFVFFSLFFGANYVYPGGAGGNPISRSLLIAAAVLFVKMTFGRYTGMHLDPIRSIASTITFLLTRNRMNGGGTWMELLKLPIYIIAQWLAVMIALAVFGGGWTDTTIKTSDCLEIPTPAVCDIYPVRDVFVSVKSLDWMEAIGAMVIYGSFVFGERYFGWGFPGILGNAFFYSAGHFLIHLWWSTASGGSFNFWFWSMTAWFSNIDDPDRVSYVWPLILGVAIVMILDIVVFYVVERVIKKGRLTNDDGAKLM